MNARGNFPVRAVLSAVLAALAGPGLAAEVDTSQWTCSSCPFDKGTSGQVDVGVALVDEAAAKFGDMSGLGRKGAHLVIGGGLRHRDDAGRYGRLEAADLGLSTRRLEAVWGQEGLGSLRLGYAELPREFAQGALTPFLGVGSNTLTLPAGYPAASSADMPLGSTLQPVDIGYKRSSLQLGAQGQVGTGWSWRVAMRQDTRDGTQRLAGSFFSTSSQLIAPVDQSTQLFDLGLSYFSAGWQASLAYHGSLFKNDQASLTWANPFNPVVPGAVRGQMALAPDNQFHQVQGALSFALTPAVRASGEVAVGRMTQNEPFLPATLNTGLAAGLAALPAGSLQGQVDTVDAAARVTTTPFEGLNLSAAYTYNRRDNRTPFARYPAVSTDMFDTGAARASVPFGFTTERARLHADYRLAPLWRLSGGADLELRDRSYQEVVQTQETKIWGRVAGTPMKALSVALQVSQQRRDRHDYGVAHWFDAAENPLMRKFNLAQRVRDSGRLSADIGLWSGVDISVYVESGEDKYPHSPIGLQSARNLQFGGDLSTSLGEDTQLTVFFSAEQLRSRQAGSQAYAQPDWWATSKDGFDTLGLSVKHLMLKGALELRADLSVAQARSDLSVDAAAASSASLFPRARTKQEVAKLQGTYKLDKDWSVVASLWHERFTLQDWHLDGLSPATVGNLLALGVQPGGYTVNVVQVAARYRF